MNEQNKKMPKEMTGAELASMLKSSINFKSLGGVKADHLKLSPEQMEWWKDAKVGMFIHWGLFSILGRGEWVYHNEKLTPEEYHPLADEFIPEDFDMKEWVDLAKDFGANYMVMVARHHDGFALWDSPGSFDDFTSMKRGAERDFVKEYVEAAREQDMGVGLYYSPMDWRFPGYYDPKGEVESAAALKKQAYDQVNELTSNYGDIDILWYDGAWLNHSGSDASAAWFWEPEKLNAVVRENQPEIVVNPRSGWEGDFYCDEGSHEITGDIIPVPWEKNMNVCSGVSWGWMPDDPVSDFDWLVKMLVDVVTRGGNFLLNVGPDRNGKLSPEVAGRMRQLGQWLEEFGESVYGTRGGPFEPVDNVYGTTFKGDTAYLHILDTEAFQEELLPLIDGNIIKVTTFDGAPVEFEVTGYGTKIHLPEDLPEQVDTILRLSMDRPMKEKVEEIRFTGKE